ncbi:helix-turn-helix domain-containing protein [Streptomyces sp. NPDC002643]
MSVALVSRVSTLSVDPDDRIEFWQEYNRRALVGLTCSSYSPDGLLATQTNFRLGGPRPDGLRPAEISGNEHVIERTRRTCRDLPKDSVFGSLLTAGQAVFFHEGGCHTLRAGDVVLYDTRRPYLFGFPSAMRQLLVDIPRETFTERCAAGDLPAPLLFERGPAGEGAVAAALESVLEGRGTEDAVPIEDTALDLVRALAAPRLGNGAVPPTASSRLAMAQDYIERHLRDPGLSAERVADAIGVSARHLSRIFRTTGTGTGAEAGGDGDGGTGTSPARHILDRRLAQAYAQLTDPGCRHLTVAEIAHHWGFAGQAHFTRVFRARYARTPGEIRPPRPRQPPPSTTVTQVMGRRQRVPDS